MAMRREVFERLGGFSPGFFSYYEDIDWSWRAQLAGMRIRYEPATVIRHIGGVTSGGRPPATAPAGSIHPARP
jgi:GT2 family glycosyltransferase